MADQVGNLGARLRNVRLATGMSLREVARQLGVSPSFVSQLENGKSQPSVATLYSLAQLLNVSIDELFAVEETGAHDPPTWTPPEGDHTEELNSHNGSAPFRRSQLAFPVNSVPSEGTGDRVSVTRPGSRSRLEMDTGVVWERLATNTGSDLDFIEIVYPPHSNSTNDGRMLQHAGSEFGYLLEGERRGHRRFRGAHPARRRGHRLRVVAAAPLPQPAPRTRTWCLVRAAPEGVTCGLLLTGRAASVHSC